MTASAVLHNEAVAHVREGRHEKARELLVAAVRLAGEDAVDVRTLKLLWQCAAAIGDHATATAAGVKAAQRDALDFAFSDRLLKSIRACPLASRESQRLPAQLPTLSIVVVSQDDDRFAAADRELARAFAEWPHQRIRVKGATSMYDGYARGLAAAASDYVAFAHDDIRIGVADFAARLADAMASADLVGVAGTTRVSGPAMLWSGHPWLHGAITHKAPHEDDYEFSLLSFAGPRIAKAQAVDGVFICARRALVDAIGLDAARFHGFHFYDLDLSYRAHRAGARVTIAADLALIHASRGNADARYASASREFAAKFPQLDEPAAAHRHWYAVRLPDEGEVREMYAKLFAAWAASIG